MMISVNANLFRAAATCVSREDARSYLRGVRVTKHPEGVLLVSTDGHRIVVVLDRNGTCDKPATIALDRAALNACATNESGLALVVNDLGFPKIGHDQHEGPVLIRDKYPDWRFVVPVQKWHNVPASFNGKYLGAFGKIADILYGRSGSAIRVLTGSDPSDPALILFPNFNDAFGILMPMRADVGGALPYWMKAVMAPVERAKKRAQEKAVRDDAKEVRVARRKKKK